MYQLFPSIPCVSVSEKPAFFRPFSIFENPLASRNQSGCFGKPGFPKQPNWFEDARGFVNLERGLKKVGFSDTEINGILGNNWFNFYKSI